MGPESNRLINKSIHQGRQFIIIQLALFDVPSCKSVATSRWRKRADLGRHNAGYVESCRVGQTRHPANALIPSFECQVCRVKIMFIFQIYASATRKHAKQRTKNKPVQTRHNSTQLDTTRQLDMAVSDPEWMTYVFVCSSWVCLDSFEKQDFKTNSLACGAWPDITQIRKPHSVYEFLPISPQKFRNQNFLDQRVENHGILRFSQNLTMGKQNSDALRRSARPQQPRPGRPEQSRRARFQHAVFYPSHLAKGGCERRLNRALIRRTNQEILVYRIALKLFQNAIPRRVAPVFEGGVICLTHLNEQL